MVSWVETSWIYQMFGQKSRTERSKSNRWTDGLWETNYFTPDYDGLRKALDAITEHCNKNQTSIKSVFPLTEARTHTYGQLSEYPVYPAGTTGAGLGHGWGFSSIIGVAVLTERIEEITDEEYSRRIAKNVPAPAVTPPPLPA